MDAAEGAYCPPPHLPVGTIGAGLPRERRSPSPRTIGGGGREGSAELSEPGFRHSIQLVVPTSTTRVLSHHAQRPVASPGFARGSLSVIEDIWRSA